MSSFFSVFSYTEDIFSEILFEISFFSLASSLERLNEKRPINIPAGIIPPVVSSGRSKCQQHRGLPAVSLMAGETKAGMEYL
ncbi:hypothetical protein [Candidatus Williamhamiltonella defendens]|uniref:hypothetical protein n=1 Tax=Candidatus Williamhamiltonella defendens TaxID=138072 RepID=UPI0020C709D7|nr:hypothetical protein [Candidatus Hamiltonella defensa]